MHIRSMLFYASCQAVCPMLIDALRGTEPKLKGDERERVSVLMVSFDPGARQRRRAEADR